MKRDARTAHLGSSADDLEEGDDEAHLHRERDPGGRNLQVVQPSQHSPRLTLHTVHAACLSDAAVAVMPAPAVRDREDNHREE